MRKKIFILAIGSFILLFNLSLKAQNPGINELTASIAGISKGEIALKDLLETGEIKCSDSDFIITSFTVAFERKGDILEFKVSGNKLTTVIKDLIKTQVIGSRLAIEKIDAKSTDGTNIKLPDMFLTLK